jgi:hypothetical protein
MKETITITLTGDKDTGKSRLSYLLKLFLKEYGFEINHILDENHPSEKNFDSVIHSDIENAISLIKDKTKVIIKERREMIRIDDNELIEICQTGYEDEMKSTDEKVYDLPIKQKAYIIGRKYALIGDEVKNITNYSFQQILDEIKNS